jgi:predicted transcriptional regulator
MAIENEVFRKIKEMSLRTSTPRPLVNSSELAMELGITRDALMPSLNSLKQLRLVNFNDPQGQAIRLTLLGTVVKRDKVDKV